MPINVVLHEDKITKGAVRFKEDIAERPLMIYLLKSQVSDLGNPKSINVTIEAA